MNNKDKINELVSKYFKNKESILKDYESLIKFCNGLKESNIYLNYEDFNTLILNNKKLYNTLYRLVKDKNSLNDILNSNNDYVISFIEVYANLKDININELIENNINYNKENDIEYYLNQIKTYKVLNKEETYNLLKKYKKFNDENAKKILIESNLRLVFNIAKKYINYTDNFLDLIQEGTIGLIIAIDKFDLNTNNNLSTYAIWWIRQRIIDELNCNIRNIQIPTYFYDKIYNMNKIIDNYYKEYGKIISSKELCNLLSITQKELDLMNIYKNDTLSSTTPIYLEEDDLEITLEETLKSNIYLPDEILTEKAETEELMMIFKQSGLSDKEIQILILRFGLFNNNEHILSDIAEMYNTSKQRINQIITKSLEKIRNHLTYIKENEEKIINIFNSLNIYDYDIILETITNLKREEKFLLKKAFGDDYTKNLNSKLNDSELEALLNILIPKMKKIIYIKLDVEKSKKLEKNISNKTCFFK